VTSLIQNSTDLPPSPGTESRKADAAKIREMYEKGVRDIRETILTYQENSAYIEGQQWVFRHRQTNQIIEMPRNSRRVRASIPRIGPESRRLFSKLLRRQLVFEVVPDAPDDETIRGAAIAQGVLEHLAREQKWERIREELAWNVWKGGTAALCLDWDPNAGKNLGTTMSGKSFGEGDVKVSALSIAEMATTVGTRDIEKAFSWIKAQAVPPEEAKMLYGLAREPQTDASAALTPVQTKLARAGSGEVPKQLTLVLTYYERPNKKTPKGRVCTVIGDDIVDGPHDWPFPFTDRLNLVCTRETLIEGRWTGRTVVSDAVPVQTALNHAWTSILEHLKQAGNARIQMNSAEKHNADSWTDDPGEFTFYDVEKWEWMSPPAMPDWWQRTPEALAAAMDDIIGMHDVSRGQAPSNIESGLGISILVEQDDTPTGRLSQTLADAWGEIATMILQTYEQNVSPEENRPATPNAPGAYVQEKFRWNGQSFAGQTVATVPYEAVAPMTEAARFARAMALVDRQVIQGGPQLSAYIDMPGKQSMIERINPQVAKARRENYQLGSGEPCIPAEFDNHAIHIEEHNIFRLSARYERSDERTRGLIDMHVQAHSTLAAEEAAEQLLKSQFAPSLAGAAQGTQPPGSALPGMDPMGQMGQVQPESATLGAREGGDPNETVEGPTGNSIPNPVENALPM
jgi:hypothetical protein